MQTMPAIAKIKTDNSPVNMPVGLAFIPKQTNRKLLAAAWKAAGLAPRYPMVTKDVFSLLTICEYDATRKTLDYHLMKRYFDAPDKQNIDGRSQFAWKETDVIAFADSLESTRNWIVGGSQIHVHKFTPDQLAKASRLIKSRNVAFQAFEKMTVMDLFHLLTVNDKKETRELLVISLKRKLGLLHVKGDEETTAPVPENN